MHWEQRLFSQLTAENLYQILQLRSEIFVVEQNCVYQDLDDKDRHPETIHLFATDLEGKILAYARLLAPELSYPQASIGRVLVAKAVRGQGLAKGLMQRAVQQTQQQWPQRGIQIGAQCYLLEFYQGFGFIPQGEAYLEDGLPHIDMRLE